MAQATTIRATLPTLLQLSAITADASATTRATAPIPDQQQPIDHPTNDLQTMKMLLLAISNALTSSPTLAKLPKIIQDTITKPSEPPPWINLMINHPTSHGPTLPYLR